MVFIVVKSDLQITPPLKFLLPVFDFQWYCLENTGEFFCISLGTLSAFILKGMAGLWEVVIGRLGPVETQVSICILYTLGMRPLLSLGERASPG